MAKNPEGRARRDRGDARAEGWVSQPRHQMGSPNVLFALRIVGAARAVLETMPQGKTTDARFVKWLKDHQKEAGVFTTVAGLVANLSDNEAAKLTAQEIADRVRQAQQSAASPAAVTA